MKVLLTNNTLSVRAGSELTVRDVSLGLLKRGHTVFAYSQQLGSVAEEISDAGVVVVDNLSQLHDKPDVIHAHHHIETMAALLHFPDTPAVFFCHGVKPWEELAPLFPRIVSYVAVDQPCRERLRDECAVPENRIEVLYNTVDLNRFVARDNLPTKPRRALIFSNYAVMGPAFHQIREACQELGIELDVMGASSGNSCSHPEQRLGEYDIVFAKARAAMEAMATGAAVVISDYQQIGPLVTTENFDKLRPLNFGFRCLESEISRDAVLERLRQYDASNAGMVHRRIREVANFEHALDRILDLYQRAIDTPLNHAMSDEYRASSQYITMLGELTKQFKRDANSEKLRAERLLADTLGLTQRLDSLKQRAMRLARNNRQRASLLRLRRQDHKLLMKSIRKRDDEIATLTRKLENLESLMNSRSDNSATTIRSFLGRFRKSGPK